jgi:hypothetical protein
MKVWRLVAHHEDALDAVEEMKVRNRIAIGWSKIGDLQRPDIVNASKITSLITQAYPDLNNANLGGPSLWNLYKEMSVGDLVIIQSNRKRSCVFEVLGSYLFEDSQHQIKGYSHQRAACLTSIDAEMLWKESGGKVKPGQNTRWTLFECNTPSVLRNEIFEEGERYEITATAIERNPHAREKCLEHHGYNCFVCEFNFKKVYGDIGKDYIHVHHRTDISTKHGKYEVDPVIDLIPLCPNCHAMVHTRRPISMPVEELVKIYKHRNKDKA